MTEPKNVNSDASYAEEKEKRKRGRPKCFDEKEALNKAMLLFWEYGYEATSMSDLLHTLNITAPSLYSSFGDKLQLFYRCLDYYLENEACAIVSIFQQAKTAKVAIELYLHENVQKLVQDNKPKGCMLLVSTMNCSEQHHQLQQDLLEKRQNVKRLIYERLVQGVHDGDLKQDMKLDEMANFYSTISQGLSMQARDEVAIEDLQQVVNNAMKVWDLFL
ncbi:TetR/AcrR family transcriptional regulator [Acinetobacter stercoris]|uniref:HTH-type transcriptional repressor ComR n=1 Tax=Acinetobacter stercoris TaxID=2126983 RepID=A0A2U3N1J2_9GAMM|nr:MULTISPECIES: TetR/AcrR family transcriptional regulator [Acinetobacter]SPL71532.1 HTH-type transcriptional repressor ComR [Acinetobacter stercoris]